MSCERLTLFVCLAAVACGAPAEKAAASPAKVGQEPPRGEGIGLGNGLGAKKLDVKRVNGRLPPEIIQKVVRENFGGIMLCYEEGLARQPTLKGRIATKFVIDADGSVSSAADVHDAPPTEPPELEGLLDGRSEQEAPRFPDAKVTACVVSKFKALKFPQPEGGKVTVVYPVVFNPAD